MHNGPLRTFLGLPQDKILFPLDCRLRRKNIFLPDEFAPSSGWQGCWQAGTDARTQVYLVGSISPEDVPTSPSWTGSAQLAAGLELRWAKGAKPKA